MNDAGLGAAVERWQKRGTAEVSIRRGGVGERLRFFVPMPVDDDERGETVLLIALTAAALLGCDLPEVTVELCERVTM